MIKKLRIVFSGIENSGKSTLSRAVASELGFEFIEEQCRYNKAVIEGVETTDTLISLQILRHSSRRPGGRGWDSPRGARLRSASMLREK